MISIHMNPETLSFETAENEYQAGTGLFIQPLVAQTNMGAEDGLTYKIIPVSSTRTRVEVWLTCKLGSIAYRPIMLSVGSPYIEDSVHAARELHTELVAGSTFAAQALLARLLDF